MSDSMLEAARRAAKLRAERDAAANGAGPAAPAAASDTAVASPAEPSAKPAAPPQRTKSKPAASPPAATEPAATQKPAATRPAAQQKAAGTEVEEPPAKPAKSKLSGLPKLKLPHLKAKPGDDKPGLLDKPPEPKPKGWKYLLGLAIRIGVFAGAVILLLVGVDFGAAAVVENKMSQQIHTAFRLHDDPAVNIHGYPVDLWGFPFSNQALTGTYDDIDVRADVLAPNRKLHNVEYDVELHDMHADIGDVMDGNIINFQIPRATSGVHIRQADLGRLTGLPNLYIEPASAKAIRNGNYEKADQDEPSKNLSGTTGIKMRATVHKVDVEVYALATVSGQSVTIDPHHAQTVDGKQLPSSIDSAAMSQTATTITLPRLPFGVHPRTVSVDSGAIIAQGHTKHPHFTG